MSVSAIGQMTPGRLFLFHHLRFPAQSGLQPRTPFRAIRSDDSSVLFRGRIDGDDAMGTVTKRHRFREGISNKMECLAQFLLNLVLCGCRNRFFFVIHVRVLLVVVSW